MVKASPLDAEQLPTLMGQRVRQFRTARAWTLDELADRSGVSRRAVVNVEQGVSNVSIATLLRLSTALGVSLASIVEAPHGALLAVRHPAEQQVCWQSPAGGKAVLLVSTAAPDVVELWEWRLGPHDEYSTEQHSAGTREVMHVLSGSVRLTVGSNSVTLLKGDALAFPGDVPHTYANATQRDTRFSLAVYQPGVSA